MLIKHCSIIFLVLPVTTARYKTVFATSGDALTITSSPVATNTNAGNYDCTKIVSAYFGKFVLLHLSSLTKLMPHKKCHA